MGKLKGWLERCIFGLPAEKLDEDQEHNIFKDLDAMCTKKIKKEKIKVKQ